MRQVHCQDCKYRPENLVFADTCLARTTYTKSPVDIRHWNRDNDCFFYKRNIGKLLMDFTNKIFRRKKR